MWKAAFPLAAVSLAGAIGCGSSGSSGCSTSGLTCGAVLPASQLMSLEPSATGYSESGHLPCQFMLPSSSGGIFQVFCGDAALLMQQKATAETAYPCSTIETDSVGMKSFEMVVGPPMQVGSTAEVNVLTTNGKYVFNVSLSNAAANIGPVRELAALIDAQLSVM